MENGIDSVSSGLDMQIFSVIQNYSDTTFTW